MRSGRRTKPCKLRRLVLPLSDCSRSLVCTLSRHPLTRTQNIAKARKEVERLEAEEAAGSAPETPTIEKTNGEAKTTAETHEDSAEAVADAEETAEDKE